MVVVGKFYELYKEPDLPKLKDLIGEEPLSDKAKILQYLRNGKKGAVSPAKMKDMLTGEDISGVLCCYNDGKYVWRSETIYYFDKYNLKLEDHFLQYIRTKQGEIKKTVG